VLVEETARYLITRNDGVYLDLTCGGGGHLKYIASLLSEKALLVGIDRDPVAVTESKEALSRLPQKSEVINIVFDRFDEALLSIGISKVDGVFLDAGLSSHQIDSPHRGFSFTQDGPLDMRMGPDSRISAEIIVNDYTVERLAAIFREYGEEKRSFAAARAICSERKKGRITTTGMLREILIPVLSPKYRNASLARIFQAIRIEVNEELEQLKRVMPKALEYLATGGHIVVISYHSLEDRIVKRFLSEKALGCTCPPDFPVCVCGKKPSVKLLTKKAVRPGDDEMEANTRSRSAKLRAAEKIA